MPEYDPLLTASALNMAIVSLHRITSTRDRLILDREYKNIINNLRMGEINADPELTSLYQEIVRVIHKGRLRDEMRALIERNNVEDKRKTIGEIVAGNVLSSFDMNPLEWLGRLASSSMSEYFRSEKATARHAIYNEEKERRLRADELTEYDELQRKLLGSSWKLLRQYELPDSYRLTQNALDKFYAAIQKSDPSKRLRMLRYIEGEFSMYSPYWFYRAKAAKECGELEEAKKFFAKFNEIWRPVLRKDPYRVEALKHEIDGLIRAGISDENADMIRECLSEMRENTELEDWPNNIYMGMVYITLGDRETAIDCVMCNIDFGFETRVSGNILRNWGIEDTKAQEESPQASVSMNLTPPPSVEEVEPVTEKVSLWQRLESFVREILSGDFGLCASFAVSIICILVWSVSGGGDGFSIAIAFAKFLAVILGLILGKKYGTIVCTLVVMLLISDLILKYGWGVIWDNANNILVTCMFFLIAVGTWVTGFLSERYRPCLQTFILSGLCGSMLFEVAVCVSSVTTNWVFFLLMIPMDFVFSLTAALMKQSLQKRKRTHYE